MPAKRSPGIGFCSAALMKAPDYWMYVIPEIEQITVSSDMELNIVNI